MLGGWSGIWQWVVVLVIVLILFGGRGKISALMGDVGKGLRSFKSGLKQGEEAADEPAEDPKAIEANASVKAEAASKKDEA